MFIEDPVRETDPAVSRPARSETKLDLRTFLDELLAEQQQLQTPVARFAKLDHAPSGDRHSAFHRDLIPLTAPAPGEQYAFEVDLDACSGCKACVAGCHSLNGLDETETWRDVGTVIGGYATHPFQQTITSACHHCADPACLNGCPVLAYEKDPVTGIVRHLDDQCIGCSYCILKCPYDVPKFNHRLGIVRKCDMCHSRLAAGEAPACVQSCPTHAIRIVKVATTPESNGNLTSSFLAAAPDPSYTLPTTRYVSKRELPANLRAADADILRPQPPHWALIILLVLTQSGYGILLANATGDRLERFLAVPLAWGFALVGGGLFASVAHLGKPLRAWRVFLGLRRSWLSREAICFGLSAGLIGAHAANALLARRFGRGIPWFDDWSNRAYQVGVLLGVAGVICSIMIYVDTRRQFWRWPLTTMRMGGTLLVGAAGALAPVAAAGILAGKLAIEATSLFGKNHSARLQRSVLRPAVLVRFALGIGAVVLFALGNLPAAFTTWLLGEFAERYLYFRAVDAPKMPGVAAR